MKKDLKIVVAMMLFISLWKGLTMLYWAIPSWIGNKYWAYYSVDPYNWYLSQSYERIAQNGLIIVAVLGLFYAFIKLNKRNK